MRRSDEKLVASAIERCLDVMGEKCRRNEPDLKYDEKLDRKGHTRLSKAGNKATANAAAVTAAVAAVLCMSLSAPVFAASSHVSKVVYALVC